MVLTKINGKIRLDGDRIVPIYGGGRVIGRIGGWDIGFFDMQTAAEGQLSYENCGVFRVRRQIFNPYSYAGGIMTSGVSARGCFNLVYGLDAQIRLFGDDYLTLKWAQSFGDGRDNDPVSLAPARIYAS